MTRMRERISQRLKDSQNTYALLTTFNEIDMSGITNLRNEYKDAFLEKHGVKLGFMSCFVRAASIALREQPSINAGNFNYFLLTFYFSACSQIVVP